MRTPLPSVLPVVICFLFALGDAAAAQDLRLDRRHRVTPAPWFVEDVALEELTGDGVLDLVLQVPDALEVWRGSAEGTFVDLAWSTPPGGFNGTDFAATDVDGDGDGDLVLARTAACFNGFCAGGTSDLYLNDGSGQFAAVFGQLPPHDDHATSVVRAGDLDGDGDRDLVLGGAEACWFDVFGGETCLIAPNLAWRNDGAGGFTEIPGAFPAESQECTAITLADLTGDGAVDAFMSLGSSTRRLYFNDGTGIFTNNAGALGFHPGKPTSMATAYDAENDGDLDLLVTYAYQGTASSARLFRNDGSGNLTWDSGELGGFGASHHAAVDFEPDGDVDLLLGGNFDARTYVNDGSGSYSLVGPVADYQLPKRMRWGDVDGDGDGDALLDVQLFLGDGAGAMVRATEAVPWPHFATGRSVVLVDVDGDLDLDVASGGFGFAINDLYTNDGSGQFAIAPAGGWSSGGSLRDVIAADLDGDGDPDLAAAYGFGSALAATYRNTGGTFDAAATLPDSGGSGAVAAADVDLDGDADLALGRSVNNNANKLYLNGGAGVFADASNLWPGPVTDTEDLVFADFDGDGDPDLVEAVDGEDRLYRNAGGSLVDSPGLLPPHTEWTTAYAAADVDGDGDLDLMAATSSFGLSAPNRLFLNTGSGFLDASANLQPGSPRTWDVDLADFDLDGDVDAFWTNDSPVGLLDNDGTGVFTEIAGAVPLVTATAEGAGVGDIDGDGDPDVFGVTLNEHFVLFNLRRQLAWEAVPRVGKPLSFRLNGSPGAPWFLSLSLAQASVPLPPFGTLHLDLGQLLPLGSGVLDGAGAAQLTVAVPASAGLVGTQAYTQALVGNPLELTNLEIVGFTDL